MSVGKVTLVNPSAAKPLSLLALSTGAAGMFGAVVSTIRLKADELRLMALPFISRTT